MSRCGKIKLRFMGYLADLYGSKETEVEVCGEQSINELVRLPDIDLEDLVILVNGRGARPQARVKPGDTVVILPHISGGV